VVKIHLRAAVEGGYNGKHLRKQSCYLHGHQAAGGKSDEEDHRPPAHEILVSLGMCAIVLLAMTAPLLAAEVAGDREVGAKVIETRGTVEIAAEGQAATN